MISVSKAIMSLRPNTEWTMSGDDIESIIWHTKGVEPLTHDEVQAEIMRLEEQAAQEFADREEAKGSALAKLQALGLTAEEARAIAGI